MSALLHSILPASSICSANQLGGWRKALLDFCGSSVSTFWKLIANNLKSACGVKSTGRQLCGKMRVLTRVERCHQDFVLVIPRPVSRGSK